MFIERASHETKRERPLKERERERERERPFDQPLKIRIFVCQPTWKHNLEETRSFLFSLSRLHSIKGIRVRGKDSNDY